MESKGLTPPTVTVTQSQTQSQTQTQTQTAIQIAPTVVVKALSEEEYSRVLISQRLQKEKQLESSKILPTQLCTICFSDYPMDQIYTLDSCSHKYCITCLADWITSKITDAQVKSIVCPDPRCHTEVLHSEVYQIVKEKSVLDKYEKFTLQRALESIPDLRWCPRPGCGNAMIGGADTLLMRCSNPTCMFSFCFNCKEQWHADASCAQYQAWKRDSVSGEKTAQQWIRQNTKNCPTCLSPIEKNGGCNHMTCSKCHYEFCWICLQHYTSNHFSGRYSSGGCAQYS